MYELYLTATELKFAHNNSPSALFPYSSHLECQTPTDMNHYVCLIRAKKKKKNLPLYVIVISVFSRLTPKIPDTLPFKLYEFSYPWHRLENVLTLYEKKPGKWKKSC
jgi:hypothetical protein